MISLSWDLLHYPVEEDAESTARQMVGDGERPNKYWVSASEQFYTNRGNPGLPTFEWSGDVYLRMLQKHEIHGPYDTFRGASSKMHSLALRCVMPHEDEFVGGHVEYHSVQMEDRLSGLIYEGYWHEYYSDEDEEPEYEWEWSDDTRYTRGELGDEFV